MKRRVSREGCEGREGGEAGLFFPTSQCRSSRQGDTSWFEAEGSGRRVLNPRVYSQNEGLIHLKNQPKITGIIHRR
jgi:hypothetical protein